MLESAGCPPGVLSPCGEESGDEELSVLPRHTKVVVTGNNRTKSVLVGLHGVVKKAVGLGGWHWLVLKNGVEVKLQRNALSVIEAPTGHEDDEENDCENPFWSSSDLASEEFQKPYKPKVRPHKPAVSMSKTVSRNNATEMQSTDSKSTTYGIPKVNLSKLETAALWRYWRHFNLVEVGPNPSKEQLVHAVERHFISQVIAGFVQAAKRLKTVCVMFLQSSPSVTSHADRAWRFIFLRFSSDAVWKLCFAFICSSDMVSKLLDILENRKMLLRLFHIAFSSDLNLPTWFVGMSSINERMVLGKLPLKGRNLCAHQNALMGSLMVPVCLITLPISAF
eukprot:Gb_06121 [translate_table: standard]